MSCADRIRALHDCPFLIFNPPLSVSFVEALLFVVRSLRSRLCFHDLFGDLAQVTLVPIFLPAQCPAAVQDGSVGLVCADACLDGTLVLASSQEGIPTTH